jgi:hypothetical protein
MIKSMWWQFKLWEGGREGQRKGGTEEGREKGRKEEKNEFCRCKIKHFRNAKNASSYSITLATS